MNKKEDILKSALTLFVERGEQSTSMKCVAKHANCGIGTMYNYFESKVELINELYLAYKTKLFRPLNPIIDAEACIKNQFILAWLQMVDFALQHPTEYKFLQAFSHSPKISKETAEKVQSLIKPVMRIYEEGKKQGLIKDLDSIELIMFTNGAITASIMNNPNMNEETKKTIINMAWDAIKR
ncbi:MAG: hypothetical protein B7C24_08485 [Bacteroidetes bacterium 4572_77]|nr:MAG: hypothetical protein B7C24_08485 [Bacteroidetes bacterium 4572_77]